jgi:hypothetical protein
MATPKKAAPKKVAPKVAPKKVAPKTAAIAVALILGSPILTELAKAAKVTAKKGEADVALITRTAEAVGSLPDAEFGKLSKPAQDYFNKVAEATNTEGAAIPLPPDTKEAASAATAPSANKAKTPASNKAKVPTPKTKTAAAAPATPRGEGVAHKVRVAVVNKSDITFDAVAKKVGVEPKIGGHAWNIFNEAKRVMELVDARAAA